MYNDIRNQVKELNDEVVLLNEKVKLLNDKASELSLVVKNSEFNSDGVVTTSDIPSMPINSSNSVSSIPTPLTSVSTLIPSMPINSSNSVSSIPTPLTSVSTLTPLTPLKSSVIPLKKDNSLEENIGKKVMGILASILIFIGLGSFVFLILDDISDMVKMLLTFVFSCCILGLGLWRLKKCKNTFTVSLTGCGVGTFYIAILMSCFYFKILGSISLFLLLMVWSSLVYILYKRINISLFLIISYIGFNISILISASLITLDPYIGIFILCLLHTLVGSKIMHICVNSNATVSSFILLFCNMVASFSCVRFALDIPFIGVSNLNILFILSVISLILSNIYLLKSYFLRLSSCTEVVKNICLPIFTFIVTLINSYLFGLFLTHILNFFTVSDIANTGYFDIGMFISFIVTLILIELLRVKDITLLGRNIFLVFSSIVLCILSLVFYDSIYIFETVISFETIISMVGFSYLFIPYFVYGFLKKDNVFKILSVFIALASIILGYSNVGFVFIFIHTCFPPLAITQVKLGDSLTILVGLYLNTIFILLHIGKLFGELLSNLISPLSLIHSNYPMLSTDIVSVVMYTFVSLFILLVWYSNYTVLSEESFCFRKLDLFEHNVLWKLNTICNYVLLLLGLMFVCSFNYNIYLHGVLVLITLLLYFTDIKSKLEDKSMGYYLGFKTTIFVGVVLYSFTSSIGYLLSITYILLAAIAIIFGFNKEIKSLRLYGLYLALFSIFKLLLIDINYTNSISRIFSFIGSGIVCFGIVWVYNKMSSKNNK